MKNLRELIRASGTSGIDGQSFKTNVTQAGQGIKMTDYLVTGWTFTEKPPDPIEVPGATLPDNSLIYITASFARGGNAGAIQRTDAAAWGISMFPVNGNPGITSIALEEITNTSNGATIRLGLRVRGALVSNATTQATNAIAWEGLQTPAVPNPPTGITVQGTRFSTQPVQTNGDGGANNYYVDLLYDPDMAQFNAMLHAITDIRIRVANRGLSVDDFDYYWYANLSGSTGVDPVGNTPLIYPYGTYNVGDPYPAGPYPTYPNGTGPGETARLYLFYKLKTEAMNMLQGPITVQYQDPRQAQ